MPVVLPTVHTVLGSSATAEMDSPLPLFVNDLKMLSSMRKQLANVAENERP